MSSPKIAVLRLAFDPEVPLHIGGMRDELAQSQKTFHSDALYSAILSAWAALGKEAWIEDLQPMRFALSSLFPYTQARETAEKVYFLPRIYKPFDIEAFKERYPGSWLSYLKRLKEISWLDLKTFSQQVQQPKGLVPVLDEIQQAYLSPQTIDPAFIRSTIFPRVRVPRTDGEATPYYVDRLYFARGSGLYLIMGAEPEVFETMLVRVRAALQYLSEAGIGTDRNVGNGQFSLEIATQGEMQGFQALFAGKGAHLTNLSLFNPEDQASFTEMTQGSGTGYDLLKRGGWITTQPYQTYRKPSLYFLREGSVFHRGSRSWKAGACLDLRTHSPFLSQSVHHPIWRIGCSLFIPVQS